MTLHQALDLLSADERRILRVLSVICEPVSQTVLQQVSDTLGWKDQHRAPLSRLMGKDLRERLLAAGLIEKRQNNLICHPDLLEPLTRECVADKTFAAIVKAAERIIPYRQNRSWEQPLPEEHRLRMLRIAIYSGPEQKALELCGLSGKEPAGTVAYRTVALLARVCTNPIDADWLRERAGISDPIEPAYRVLGELAAILAGQHRLAESPWLSHSMITVTRGPVPPLFQALALHWLGEAMPADLPPALAAYARQAFTAGYDWYAREAVALLAAVGFKGELPTLTEAPAGLTLMTGLLAPKPAWQLALEALKGLTVQPAAAAATGPAEGPDQRMAWLFGLHGGFVSLEPREQKRMKRGGWTQGRAVSLQKLAETPDDYPYLTPQDRAICACIIREQESTWYGNQTRTVYELDLDRALVAAVGHPLVLRPAAGEAPVELVSGGPTLNAVRRRKDILVSIEPFPPADRSVLPVAETPQRIRLVQFDAGHRQIGRILGQAGLSVPKGAEAQLLEGLAAVAPLLTVHSDSASP